MFVVLRQALVAAGLIFAITHMRAKYFIGLWTLAVFLLVLFGSFTSQLQWLPGKSIASGRINIMKASFFLPYYAVVLVLMIGGKAISTFRQWESYSEVDKGIYVGDYYSSFLAPIQWGSIIDITNELPRLGSCKQYLNIPSWDGCPPSIENIERAVRFAEKAPRPLLIHCAHGKGRSATVATACLRASGSYASINNAITSIKQARPQTSVNARMRKVLNSWEKVFMYKKVK